jgi:hypothetical protein
MKLFSSTQISWCEPWFFLFRIREASNWRIRIFIAIGLAVAMFIASHFFSARQLGLPREIGVSLAFGLLITAIPDIRNCQREVTVKEDSIIVNGAFGRGRFETFNFNAIKGVQLMRPAEWGKAYGGMAIVLADGNYLAAVPPKVSLDTLANVLHRLGVAVSLSDWEPSAGDTRIGIRNQVELDPMKARGEIGIRPVGAQEGPLLSPANDAVQVVIALGPLLLALIGAIVVVVILCRNWSDMSILARSLYGGGALLAIVAAFLYMVLIGQFAAVGYGVRSARNCMPTRPNSLFRGTEDDLVAVQIYDRKSWTATIAKSSDYGFLRIDRRQGLLLFEGNKFRWTLPTSALTACRIEESIVGSEGNPNAQKRYFVVLQAAKNGEIWEAGMIYTRTEMGNDTAESRYKRAQLLFTQLAEVV